MCARAQQLRQLGFGQWLQHIDLRARQQRAVHLERRVLGGGADEGDQSLLDERQERILLRLVEAVHFVDEQDGMAAMLLQHQLRLRNRLADVLDAGQHRGQRHELGIERRGHQPRQCGLAHPRRPPQDHRMQLARFECQPQRPAWSQQVGLADHFVDVPGAQALSQRRGWLGRTKQAVGMHGTCAIRSARRRPWAE